MRAKPQIILISQKINFNYCSKLKSSFALHLSWTASNLRLTPKSPVKSSRQTLTNFSYIIISMLINLRCKEVVKEFSYGNAPGFKIYFKNHLKNVLFLPKAFTWWNCVLQYVRKWWKMFIVIKKTPRVKNSPTMLCIYLYLNIISSLSILPPEAFCTALMYWSRQDYCLFSGISSLLPPLTTLAPASLP